MGLHIELHVKFRALFIDLAKFDEVWNFPLAGLPITNARDLLTFDRNGVKLSVTLRTIAL